FIVKKYGNTADIIRICSDALVIFNYRRIKILGEVGVVSSLQRVSDATISVLGPLISLLDFFDLSLKLGLGLGCVCTRLRRGGCRAGTGGRACAPDLFFRQNPAIPFVDDYFNVGHPGPHSGMHTRSDSRTAYCQRDIVAELETDKRELTPLIGLCRRQF